MPYPRARQRPSKYQPIADFFAARADDRALLSFTAIETILGFALPLTARGAPDWWRKWYLPHVQAWLTVGWEAHPQVGTGRVLFTRCPPQDTPVGPPPRPSKYQPIADFLATQTADMVRLSFDAIEEILTFALPTSTQLSASWWRAHRYSWVQTWSTMGWTAWPVVGERFVLFTRAPSEG